MQSNKDYDSYKTVHAFVTTNINKNANSIDLDFTELRKCSEIDEELLKDAFRKVGIMFGT